MQKYDFDSTKERLLERILAQVNANDPTYPAWKDRFESSTGVVFIELMAASIDSLGFYLERRVVENYMNTATLRSSVFNLAAGLGYTPSRKLAAVGTANLLFNTPVSETLYIPAGTVLSGDYDVTALDEFVIPVGPTAIGTGTGVRTAWETNFGVMIEAGTFKVYVDGVEVAQDNGIGVVYGPTIASGTINYTTGAVSITFLSAPAVSAVITADYDRNYEFTVYQGERETYELRIDETTSYIELPDSFIDISETYVTVFVTNQVTGATYEYSEATTGVQRASSTDRWYWARYSFDDKLRLYFRDDNFGRNPFADGTLITVVYMTTDGAAGVTAASYNGTFPNTNAPVDGDGGIYSAADYTLTIGTLTGGQAAESVEHTRIHAINLYAAGLRAVQKQDYRYWIESISGIEKASPWSEEDVNPPNIDMRNTVKFTGVDDDCTDIDNSIVYGTAIITEDAPGSGQFKKITDYNTDFATEGVVAGDRIVIARELKIISGIVPGDNSSLLLTTNFDSAYLSQTPYHITRDAIPLSRAAITTLSDYMTATVFMEYEPPIILSIDLLVDIEVEAGYVSSTVVSNVTDALEDRFVPTFFEFNESVAVSYFWDTVMGVNGVKTAAIYWSVNNVPITSDYYTLAGDETYRQIPTLRDTSVEVRGQRVGYQSSSSSSSASSGSSRSSSKSSSSSSSTSSESSSFSSSSSKSSVSSSRSSSSSKSSVSSSRSSSSSKSSSRSSSNSSRSSSSSAASSSSSSESSSNSSSKSSVSSSNSSVSSSASSVSSVSSSNSSVSSSASSNSSSSSSSSATPGFDNATLDALNANLIAAWHFDESSGVRADSVGAYDLADINTVGYNASGKYKGCADFEKDDSESLFDSGADISKGLTKFMTSFWIRPETDSGTGVDAQVVLAEDEAYGNSRIQVMLYEKKLRVTMRDSVGGSAKTVTSSTLFSTGTWYHILVLVDTVANKIYGYVNGAQQINSTLTMSAIVNDNAANGLRIGADPAGSLFHYDGRMDEMCVWNAAPASIAAFATALYNSGTGRYYSG